MEYEARRIGVSHRYRVEDDRVSEVYASWGRGFERTQALADLNPQPERHWASDSRSAGLSVGLFLLLFVLSIGLGFWKLQTWFAHWYGIIGCVAAIILVTAGIHWLSPFRVYYRVFRNKSGRDALVVPSFRKENPEFEAFVEHISQRVAELSAGDEGGHGAG